MKNTILLAAAFLALSLAMPAHAQTVETPASHAILIDAQTGTLLLDKKSDEQMPTSSMSKAMTLYMVFDALKAGKIKLTDELPISEKAWRMGGSRMFAKLGTNVPVEELIRGVAIQSGNDASVALAEGVAGTEEAFAERMNIKAKEIGMNNSHFMNASGWPVDGHYSTPRDLSTLALNLIADFPEYYHYFGEKEFVYNKIRQSNRDPLLGKVQGADGIKTGHTDIAGYGLIGSAQRDGRRLVLVINGLSSEKERAEEGAKLMEWGFRNFENRKLYSKGDKIETAKVWLGKQDVAPLVAPDDIIAVLPTVHRDSVKITVNYTSPLKAPIKQGDVIGKLRINIPGQPVAERELYAANDVARKGFFGRAAARLSYLISGTF